MIVAKNCYFWSVFPQISCGGYPQNSSKFPKPNFLLTCTYFGGRRHGRNLPMAKATDGLAFGVTRHARARAPNKPPNPDSFRARARAPAHMRKGCSGAHKLSQNHGIYDVFAASEKTKIEDKDSEKTKTLYFTMFLACRVQNSRSEKCLKHRCLQCFVLPPKTKQRYVRCFPTLNTPK